MYIVRVMSLWKYFLTPQMNQCWLYCVYTNIFWPRSVDCNVCIPKFSDPAVQSVLSYTTYLLPCGVVRCTRCTVYYWSCSSSSSVWHVVYPSLSHTLYYLLRTTGGGGDLSSMSGEGSLSLSVTTIASSYNCLFYRFVSTFFCLSFCS